ncbi:hypothetical protein [Gimesia aquarii]|nr:hypothetical protein [Gimesia aquarii]
MPSADVIQEACRKDDLRVAGRGFVVRIDEYMPIRFVMSVWRVL